MTDRARVLRACLLAALAVASACDDPQEGWQAPELRSFQEVYPFLIRDCGFHACHGAEDRFFKVYGRGRARINDELRAFDRTTGEELSLSFSSALSMLDLEHPERSLLLIKPLAESAGGAAHGGIDDFGRNVYRTTQDDGYLAIRRFALAMTERANAD